MPNEVYAAFCLTTVGQGYIANIDASEILVRYTVTQVGVVNLGMLFVYCCIRCKIVARNTVATANSVILRAVPLCCSVRHEILKLLDANLVMYVCMILSLSWMQICC